MSKCVVCGKEEYLMYRCNYCGQQFCSEHRLPETHRCPALPKRKWKNYRKYKGIQHKKWHTLPGEKKEKHPLGPIPIHGLEPKRNFKSKKPKVWLILLLVIFGVIGVFYISDPQGLTITIKDIFEDPSSAISNFSESIIMGLNNLTTIESLNISLENVIVIESIWQPENVYGNYSFGLVKAPDGVTVNSYGDFVVLINNKNAINPKYNDLVRFLKRDKTDEYPYKLYIITPLNSYYGTAESHVNLTLVKEIVDGVKDMPTPRICVDFAVMLHNNAELSGFRCAFVSIEIGEGHALVAFNTTDKGLIYIDSTGVIGSGPPNCDKIINSLELNAHYIPRSLFPSPKWSSTWGDMGIITEIYMTWDGDWN